MTCLSIFVDLQEKQEKETLATSNGMSDEHGNEPSGNWDNLRNWGLTKCGCKLHAAGTGKRSSGQQQLLGFADWLVHPMHSKACFHLLQLLFYLSAVFFWGPSPNSINKNCSRIYWLNLGHFTSSQGSDSKRSKTISQI